MIGVSLLPVVAVRRLAIIGFAWSLGLMALVPFIGVETKGAHRWLNIQGISIQPSEFMKPCFAVVMAWVCAERYRRAWFPGNKIAIGLYALVVLLLLMQPDFGMTLTVTAMWCIQFFMAGLPFVWVLLLGALGLAGIAGAYSFFPHVAKRIDGFLDPTSGDNYQVAKSLEAFENGGVFGRGPGEGEVQRYLPDSHTDFVFSVAGEEFGMLACMIIVCIFAFVVLRALHRVWKENDMFLILAVTGLVVQFGIQAVINMGVAVNLLPAKGMTLPFLSYGGSSVLAVALGMGMLLAFTRRRFGKSL
jgi:cell division protein FtsW